MRRNLRVFNRQEDTEKYLKMEVLMPWLQSKVK